MLTALTDETDRRLGCISLLTGGEHEAHGASKATHRHMDFGAQATARTAKGLIRDYPMFSVRPWAPFAAGFTA